jgi:tRNA A-37 threonylcarbamoyl transferase component Bud32
MSNHPHPAPEHLAAFATGQAPEDSAVEISRHLADCQSCRTLIDELPEDTLVSLLRQSSYPGDAPTNDHAEVSEARTTAGMSSPRGHDVPKELADHPRYHVLGLLGLGGMGAVYKAEHRRMERPVALKVINAALMNRRDMVERFHREAKAAARLTHPNIVTAHDADQAGDIHFLVMEYVEGISLAQKVNEHGPLPVAEACDYIQQAALGMQHAFEQGMVHRDIKPHNLMLTPRGQVKILDFGLARFARETASPAAEPEGQTSAIAPTKSGLTEVGVLMGTADFIAPEQASDPHKADIRADIYSLGCTLYYLLAGHVPFPEGTAVDKLISHSERAPKPLTKIRSDIPAELARVLDKIMAKNPKDRYQTPAEVAEALTPFMDKYRPRKRRIARLAVAAGLLAAAIVAGVVIYIQTDRGEFEIWTDNDQVALEINKNGVTVHDQAGKRKYELKVGKRSLPSGEYIVSDPSGGIEFSTQKFRIVRGGKERLVATLRYGGLRDEALRWFPASATFFGGRDMSAFKELSLQQIIVLTQMVAKFNIQDRDRVWKLVSIVGDIDRVSFAYVHDAKEPAKSRIFLRVTGKLSHARLAEFFRTDWPKAMVREKKGPKGEAITLAASSEPIAPAWAIIGDSDLIAAGYQGIAGKHVEVIEQLLDLRAGKGQNLATAKAAELSELPLGTWAFFAGQPPDVFGNLFLFPVLPQSMRISIAGIRDIRAQFQGNFAAAGDARKFTNNVGALRKQGLDLLKILPLDEKTAGQLAGALKDLKIETSDARVKGSYRLPGEAGDALAGMLQKLPLGMFEKLATFFPKGQGTAGKETTMLKKFGPADKTISQDLTADQGGWRIDANEARTVRLFELPKPAVEDGIITYRAKMKSEKLQDKAYLEMWCRIPGLGEFFSKGLQNPIQGTTDWSSYEIPFFLKKGQVPDLLKLNVNLEGNGTVWIKDVEVYFAGTAAAPEDRTGKIDAAVKAALAWLKVVDEGNYALAWEQQARDHLKTSKEAMVQTYEKNFKANGQFGKVTSPRTLLAQQFRTLLPKAREGEFVVIQCRTSFDNLKDAVEWIATMRDADGQWRVCRYYITDSIKTVPPELAGGEIPAADPGKERRIKAFGPKDKPLTQADQVVAEEGGWRIDVKSRKETAVRLFEVADAGVEGPPFPRLVIYRLKIKTRLLKYDFAEKKGEAYQEMWCRFPGTKGEAFSKGLDKKVSGNTDWTEVAIPFRLEKGQRPDLIRLNLVVSGRGQVWIKDVELVRMPLEK